MNCCVCCRRCRQYVRPTQGFPLNAQSAVVYRTLSLAH